MRNQSVFHVLLEAFSKCPKFKIYLKKFGRVEKKGENSVTSISITERKSLFYPILFCFSSQNETSPQANVLTRFYALYCTLLLSYFSERQEKKIYKLFFLNFYSVCSDLFCIFTFYLLLDLNLSKTHLKKQYF